MWDDQVPALADRYTVVRFDLRGFGRTRAQPGPYSNCQDLADLLDHLGIDRAVVVGCSMGGMIALDFVLERPERAAALVWVCSGVGGVEPPDEIVDPREIALFEESQAAEESGDWERAAALDVRIWVDGPLQPEGRSGGGAVARPRDEPCQLHDRPRRGARAPAVRPARRRPARRPTDARPRRPRRARPGGDGLLRRGPGRARARRAPHPLPRRRAPAEHGAPRAVHPRPAGVPRRTPALVAAAHTPTSRRRKATTAPPRAMTATP
uniref:alpha/beta fold hydrolase n=1 Tax=Microcella sp. TaxID=1913979 RepID=UPI00351F7807